MRPPEAEGPAWGGWARPRVPSPGPPPSIRPAPVRGPETLVRHPFSRALAGLALSLVLGVSLAAADGPPAAPQPPAAGTIAWTEGFAAGAATARTNGKLLFVLVTRKSPRCGFCEKLEAGIWSKAGSSALSDKYVAVRLLGGDDATPEVDAFLERYQIEGFPTLMAMTPDGALVARLSGFDEAGRPVTPDAMLGRMDEAAAREAEFAKYRAEVTAKGDPQSQEQLAGLLMQRQELDAARDVYAKVVQATPTVEAYGMLAGLEAMTGRKAELRKTLETMLAKFPDNAERIEWRISLRTMDLPSRASGPEEVKKVVAQHETALTDLLREVDKEGKASDQAEIHYRLADLANQRRDEAVAKTHLQWIVDHDATGRRSAPSEFRLAILAYRAEDLDRAISGLEHIVAAHPTSPEAEEATRRLPEIKSERDARKKP